MRHWTGDDLRSRSEFFEILGTTKRSQLATMALAPGQVSGDFGNDHAHADQWVVVLAGNGEAVSEYGTTPIGPGDVVLIPAPEKHQFKGVGPDTLKTITFYAPAGYSEG